jgi:hypothetical protein
MGLLACCCLMVLAAGNASAMPPPAWIQPGTTITYEAALTPYYAIDSDDPMERWVHYEGTGVYGYLIDTVTGWDDYGYYGDTTVISGIDGSTLFMGTWSYREGDPEMGTVPFWVDLEGIGFGPDFLYAEGPFEIAGEEWNAQVYYYANLGINFDVRYVVDADSGLVLIKNAGLTSANGQMQREIYILQSIETGYPGSGQPEGDAPSVRELVESVRAAGRSAASTR